MTVQNVVVPAAPSIVAQRKACSVNPLKSSAPLGAALAFLGMDRCQPLFHGSQGCTAFGMVLAVRHFREAIPFQTTAMNEISTILGGLDNVEQALINVAKRSKPKLIGICSTGLTETRGEDIGPDLRVIKERNKDVLGETDVVFAATPDYVGALQEGWGKAVSAIIDTFVPAQTATKRLKQINILAGCHLTPGDLETLKDMLEDFGLTGILLPDLSGSMDGHVPDAFMGTTYGGTTIADVKAMGASVMTLAFGEHMRLSAELLKERTGVPVQVIANATGLEGCDRLMVALSEVSGQPIPARYRRQRSQLVDAMLDSHFFFGGKKVAIAADPDLLLAFATLCADLGAEIAVAVASVASESLKAVPAAEVLIGDLEDLELKAKAVAADVLITHSHGRQAAERTGIPLYRVGFPMFDRLGTAHRVSIGYKGSRDLVFELGNLFLDHLHGSAHGDTAAPSADHPTHGEHCCSGHQETGHACAQPATR